MTKWIAVEEALPTPGRGVLAAFTTESGSHRVQIAFWIPERYAESGEYCQECYPACHRWDDEADTCWLHAGWYQVDYYDGEYYRPLRYNVTDWADVPMSPRADATGEARQGDDQLERVPAPFEWAMQITRSAMRALLFEDKHNESLRFYFPIEGDDRRFETIEEAVDAVERHLDNARSEATSREWSMWVEDIIGADVMIPLIRVQEVPMDPACPNCSHEGTIDFRAVMAWDVRPVERPEPVLCDECMWNAAEESGDE